MMLVALLVWRGECRSSLTQTSWPNKEQTEDILDLGQEISLPFPRGPAPSRPAGIAGTIMKAGVNASVQGWEDPTPASAASSSSSSSSSSSASSAPPSPPPLQLLSSPKGTLLPVHERREQCSLNCRIVLSGGGVKLSRRRCHRHTPSPAKWCRVGCSETHVPMLSSGVGSCFQGFRIRFRLTRRLATFAPTRRRCHVATDAAHKIVT
ncbi:hypothetical protein O3P69_013122 [Scylla paramamosain]|uniref:Uncharacterized protein n=1 Tax=Scylla paramamosain TaxID=85552 RepID=A0AAW0U271_SCYPA